MNRRGSTLTKLIGTVLGLAAFALVGAHPASATIYQFAIPISTLQSAVAASVANPDNYVLYDIYMRMAVPSDGVGGVMPGAVTAVNGVAPTAPDSWTDLVDGVSSYNDGPGPGVVGSEYVHFFPSAGTNISVIVNNNTTDASIIGKTVNGKTASSLVPNTSQFTVMFSTPNAGLAGSVFNLYFFAFADNFTSGPPYTSGTVNKAAQVEGTFSATAQLTPEPMSLLMGGGGLLLFLVVGMRRRRIAS